RVTLHGTALPTSSATSGGSGLVEEAVPFTVEPLAGVSYRAQSRDAALAFAFNPSAEVWFSADVTFDAAGGSPAPSTQTVPWDGTAELPPITARAGHAFDGWRVGSSTGAAWDFSAPMSGPLALVARWVAYPPTITGQPPPLGEFGPSYRYAMTVTGWETTL